MQINIPFTNKVLKIEDRVKVEKTIEFEGVITERWSYKTVYWKDKLERSLQIPIYTLKENGELVSVYTVINNKKHYYDVYAFKKDRTLIPLFNKKEVIWLSHS